MDTPELQKDVAMFGSKYPREALDFYPTIDADCTRVLLPVLCERYPSRKRVWEPAAGDGRMLDIIREVYPDAYGSDVAPKRDDIGACDFLGPLGPVTEGTPDLIITNPPYVLGDAFIEQAERAAIEWKAHTFLLMRNEFDCAGASPRTPVFSGDYFRGKSVLRWRPRWIEGSTGSPRHNYAWFHIGPSYPVLIPPYIRYLDRAKKNDRQANEGLSVPANP